ncbi:ABC transporter ATP-binding protein [Lacticaseibacillus hulanensis]|uniref:ABC transporter ATP-binding protein n=1 Tax=Lacticaseibacillus hulanensis TaxID=2493111 RepID=UPI000FDAC4D4|nr:ABC transporter ATP-binding protein [Lacticaseibacillus hulanensis]
MFKLQTKQHGAWRTLIWNLKWAHNPFFWIALIGIIITNAIINVVGTLIPAITVSLLARNTPLGSMALIIVGISLVLAGAQWFGPPLDILSKTTAFETQMLQINKFLYDTVRVPYEWLLNPKYDEARFDAARFGLLNMTSGSRQLFSTFVTLMQTAVTIIILLGLLFTIKWWIPLFIIVIGLAADSLQRWHQRYRQRQRKAIAGDYARENYIDRASMSEDGSKDIRLYHLDRALDHEQQQAIQHEQSVNASISMHQFWQESGISVLTGVRNLVIYLNLLTAILTKAISVAGFTYAFNAVSSVSQQLSMFMVAWGEFKQAAHDTDNVRNLFATEDAISNQSATDTAAKLPNVPLPITFDHVYYRYPDADADTISDLNLTIPESTSIALVGVNGAGKSTLVNLVMGLLQPTKGKILLGDTPITQFNRDDYHRYFAPVFQDSDVFADTVAANIALSADFDEDRVNDAIDQAGLRDTIKQLAHGTGTQLTHYIFDDGVELSGGQTQKLMLARALYRDAPVVILDEPTAALDAIAESNVYQHYRQMMHGKTSIFISHRLASTQFTDEIMFMKKGRITERGTHKQLLASGGDYAKLFAIQSQYYGKEEQNEQQA